MDLSTVAQNIIKCVATGELCRLWSTELSSVKPQLDAHNVQLCGVGLEEFGLEEFQEGKFFTGELYVDSTQQCYKDLGFRRYNVISVLGGLAAKETRISLAKSNAKGIKGNIRGDGLLNGGMLIVTAGGEKVLLSHKQASPGDHVSNEQILDVLGITSDEPKEGESESTSASAGATCPDSACTVKEGES
ncbi:hypothetical protein OS493_006247 [Desmophyllum pertusum]|uniref:Prostamide/prostaglandin F synthase n=1 Tax=Desmophyllum pertusum TaxID=174260 RepID=A0A9X0A553_9CNID|nr:hypothetical protein OS493_006247 [Desmophyllum pertusum]